MYQRKKILNQKIPFHLTIIKSFCLLLEVLMILHFEPSSSTYFYKKLFREKGKKKGGPCDAQGIGYLYDE